VQPTGCPSPIPLPFTCTCIIVRYDSAELKAGCAGNAALNLAALGVKVRAVGVVGDDPLGTALADLLEKCGVDVSGLLRVPGRPTETKTRVLAGGRSTRADLRAAGRTILLTTHELADVERLADRVVVIDRGRVAAAGTPAELIAGSVPVLRFRLAGGRGDDLPVDLRELDALGTSLGGILEPDGGPGRFRLAGHEPDPRSIAYLADWCEQRGLLLAELRTSGSTLEERFLELVAGAGPDGSDA
jgi:hypothetical protein